MPEGKDRIFVYPVYEPQLTETGKEWLKSINEKLEKGIGLELADTIAITASRSILDVPSALSQYIRDLLIPHYGLSVREYSSVYDVDMDLRTAVFYEKFGIDPKIAIQEHRDFDWEKVLLEYQPGYIDPKRGIPFSTFVDGTTSVVVSKKAGDYFERARGVERYLPFNPDGRRMMPRPNPEYQELVDVAFFLLDTTSKQPSGIFLKEGKLWTDLKTNVFRSFQIVGLLDTSSRLADNLYEKITSSHEVLPHEFGVTRKIPRYLDLKDVLVPNR